MNIRILFLALYKYLSEKEVAFFRKEKLTDADIEKVTEDDVKYAQCRQLKR